MAWLAITIAVALVVPYFPILWSQSHTLIQGHWLDWIGGARQYPLAVKVLATSLAAAVAISLILAPRAESNADEPLWWVMAWTMLPCVALCTGSIAVRPMFNLRYVAPSMAMLALTLAAGLAMASAKLRNLSAAAIVLFCLMVVPFDRSEQHPWRGFAQQVAGRGSASEPVFFESGFVTEGRAINVSNGGFPVGYYLVPFDYYFKGSNPRITVPGFDPVVARAMIEKSASTAGGGWLVSWKNEADLQPELPDTHRFSVVQKFRRAHLAFYRISVATAASH
jgi:hypothetical protein